MRSMPECWVVHQLPARLRLHTCGKKPQRRQRPGPAQEEGQGEQQNRRGDAELVPVRLGQGAHRPEHDGAQRLLGGEELQQREQRVEGVEQPVGFFHGLLQRRLGIFARRHRLDVAGGDLADEQLSPVTGEVLLSGDQQARVRGFALDMTNGGADAEDIEFGAAA